MIKHFLHDLGNSMVISFWLVLGYVKGSIVVKWLCQKTTKYIMKKKNKFCVIGNRIRILLNMTQPYLLNIKRGICIRKLLINCPNKAKPNEITQVDNNHLECIKNDENWKNLKFEIRRLGRDYESYTRDDYLRRVLQLQMIHLKLSELDFPEDMVRFMNEKNTD